MAFILTNSLVEAARQDCYREDVRSPFVRPIRDPLADKSSPKYMFQLLDDSGKEALATNIATVLRISPGSSTALERLSAYPSSARTVNGRLDPAKDLFCRRRQSGGQAATWFWQTTRFLRISWSGGTTTPTVTSCKTLSTGCRAKKRRRACLFVEDGRVQTEFDLGIPDPPFDWWRLLAYSRHIINKGGNQLIEEVQERDLFNKMLLSKFGPDRRPIVRLPR